MTTRNTQIYFGNVDLFLNSLNPHMLGMYLIADYGEWFGVNADGSYYVGQSVGLEVEESDRPVAIAQCPGINNLDMTYWTDGWDASNLTPAECILTCVENGDVGKEFRALLRDLKESMTLPEQDYLYEVWHSLDTPITHVFDFQDGVSVGTSKIRPYNGEYLYLDNVGCFEFLTPKEAKGLLGPPDAKATLDINTLLSHMTSVETSIERNLRKLEYVLGDVMDVVSPLRSEYEELLKEANAKLGTRFHVTPLDDPTVPTFHPLSCDIRRRIPLRLQDMFGNTIKGAEIYDIASVFIGDGNCTMDTDQHYFEEDDKIDYSRMVTGCDLDLSRNIDMDTHQLWVLVDGPNDDPDGRDEMIWVAVKWVPTDAM